MHTDRIKQHGNTQITLGKVVSRRYFRRLSTARSTASADALARSLHDKSEARRRTERSLCDIPAPQSTPLTQSAVSFRNERSANVLPPIAYVREAVATRRNSSGASHYRRRPDLRDRRWAERRRAIQQIASSGPSELASLAEPPFKMDLDLVPRCAPRSRFAPRQATILTAAWPTR